MLEKVLGVLTVSSPPLMSPARTWHMAACTAPYNLKPLGSDEQRVVRVPLSPKSCVEDVSLISRGAEGLRGILQVSLARLQRGLRPAVSSGLLNSMQSWIFSWRSWMAPQGKWWQPCWVTIPCPIPPLPLPPHHCSCDLCLYSCWLHHLLARPWTSWPGLFWADGFLSLYTHLPAKAAWNEGLDIVMLNHIIKIKNQLFISLGWLFGNV